MAGKAQLHIGQPLHHLGHDFAGALGQGDTVDLARLPQRDSGAFSQAGLQGIEFGKGSVANLQPATTLLFTAELKDATNGLYGSIRPN
jgi:hypothetical protein